MKKKTAELAWVLSERGLDGKERIEGIALTNADASEFVRRWHPPGTARTCIPYPILAYAPPDPTEAQ